MDETQGYYQHQNWLVQKMKVYCKVSLHYADRKDTRAGKSAIKLMIPFN